MNKTTVEELKKIYRDKVLPKKSVLKGTPESCLKTLEIYEEFVPLRQQANEAVYRGFKTWKKKKSVESTTK